MAQTGRDLAALVAVLVGSFLIACSPTDAQLQCDSAWKATGRGGIHQFFYEICRRSARADPEQCDNHVTECCVDSDCQRGMRCTCHFNCKKMACLHILHRECDYVTEPSNGRVVQVNSTRVRVRCDANHVNVPNEAFYRDCNVARGRAWLPEIGCRRKCPHPTDIQHGDPLTVSKSYHVGSVVSYSCKNGYTFRGGVDRSVCSLDGTRAKWPAVHCDILSCNAPNDTHVIVRKRPSRYTYNSVVVYGCGKGFELVGSSRIKCIFERGDVAWNKPVPTCREKACTVPTSLGGSAASLPDQPMGTSVASGTVVSFTCPPTFVTIGSATSRCSKGAWSSHPPRCKPSCCREEDLQLAGQVAGFKDPSRLCAGSLVSEASVSCDECHSTSAGGAAFSHVVCVNESWSWVAGRNSPRCEQKTCPPLRLPFANPLFMPVIHPLGSTLATMAQACGARFELSCADGNTTLVPPVSSVVCLPTSSWANVTHLAMCRSREDSVCPSAIPGVNESELIVNLRRADRQQGASVTIDRCRDQCMRTGRADATCTLNATSGSLYWQVTGQPGCTETRCENYRVWASTANTRLRNKTRSCLASSGVRCRTGYYPLVQAGGSSSVTATCGVDGQWRHSPNVDVRCISQCSASTCPKAGEECYQMQSPPTRFACRCKSTCARATQGSDAVCGSDGVTYDTLCHLEKAACDRSANISVLPLMECNSGGRCWQSKPEPDYSYPNARTLCGGTRVDQLTYNRVTGQCEDYRQGKCHRNQGNTFTFYRDCYSQCAENRVCHLAAERGPCTGSVLRYFYNCATSQCESFSYGGCGGNENNFESMAVCRSTSAAQRCAGSDGVCSVQSQDCCASGNSRLLDMCNKADFAITGTVDGRRESDGFHLYNFLVDGIVYGSGITATSVIPGLPATTRPLEPRHTYTLGAPVVNVTSSCQSCVLIPGGQQTVFLMGRLEEGFLYAPQSAYGFVYTLQSEGKDTVCSCPIGSKLRNATACP